MAEQFAPQQTYAQMLGMAEAPRQQQDLMQAGVQGMMDPNAGAAIQQMMRPAQSPAELEARKTGWQTVVEKLNNNPNLLRSLGFAGASLAQSGNLGQAVQTGMTAYESGEYATRRQNELNQMMGMRQEEHAAGLEATRAGTELTRARLPGVQAEGQFSAETMQLRIDTTRKALERASFQLERDRSEENVTRVERELRQRRAEIEKTIPESRVRESLLADADKRIADARLARTRATREAALAGQEQMELEAIKSIKDPEELRQYFTKTGKYATTGSSAKVAQSKETWGSIYDGLPADDPMKKGKTRDQFIRDRMVREEDRDIMSTLVRALAFADPGSPEEAAIKRQLSSMFGAKSREPGAEAPPPPPPGGKPGKWEDIGGGLMRQLQPDGTWKVMRRSREFEGGSNMPGG